MHLSYFPCQSKCGFFLKKPECLLGSCWTVLHFPFALYPGLLFMPSTSICCDWNHQTNKWSLYLYCTFWHPRVQAPWLVDRSNSPSTQSRCVMSLDIRIARQPGVWKTALKAVELGNRSKDKGGKKTIKNNRWLSHTKYPVEFRSDAETYSAYRMNYSLRKDV